MIPIRLNHDKIMRFKYTVFETLNASRAILNLDDEDFDISKYFIIPYTSHDVKSMCLVFGKISGGAFINNRFYKNIPFPVGCIKQDNDKERQFFVGSDMFIFTDEYELYSWLVEMMQMVETVRFYEYDSANYSDRNHLMYPITICSNRLTIDDSHEWNKNKMPFLRDNMKSKQWQIHKKTNETGNELSESNILSDKYENLPTIHLTEDLFTGEYDSEFYCCPYFNEKDNEWIFAWYPKSYCVFNGYVKIWKKLIMDCKEYVLQKGQGFLPKHIDTIKSVQHFESRFEYLLNRIDANNITELKQVMVSFDGGIMGKIDGMNLAKIVADHYDPKEDPWSREYIGDDAPCPPIKEDDSEEKKLRRRSSMSTPMLGKVWFGDDE